MTADSSAAGGSTNPMLAVLQRVGRSLMMPIAVLPAAALLLRFGQDDMLGWTGQKGWGQGLAQFEALRWLTHVADVFGAAGAALFNNLPILFAVGVAIGFARKADGSTALAALVGYLIFDRVTRQLLSDSLIKEEVVSKINDKPDQLNLGLANPTGVLGGIAIGIIAAVLWQKYHRIKLPTYLAFFGGRRFVPIITAFVAVLLGVVFGLIWPPIGEWLSNFGDWLTGLGAVGTGVYGFINRLLLPFGLHHIVNTLVWQTFGSFTDANDVVAKGDLNRFFAGDPDAGFFMAGFFPIMMFALPAAALAMWQEARPEKKKIVGGIMLSGALCSFLTGVTEPLEFAFLFVAPLLFIVHALLTGASLAICTALGVRDGFGFSAGFIDFALNWNKAEKPWLILAIGAVYAVVYYVLFRVMIRAFNLMTPGREPDDADLVEAAAEPVEQRHADPQPTGRH